MNGRNGATENTPQNILFGAGTIHRNLQRTETGWNLDETVIGTTTGGTTLQITPVIRQIEVDGAWCSSGIFVRKIGETARLTVRFAELNKALIRMQTIGHDDGATVSGKREITHDDFWQNVAFVGRTIDNRHVIVILANALCTTGLSVNTPHKAGAGCDATFECHTSGDPTCLPWQIIYPEE